jgi:lysophospholipase L1-like esterase
VHPAAAIAALGLTERDPVWSRGGVAARTINLAFGALALLVVLALAAATIAWWRGRHDVERGDMRAESVVMLGDSITFGGDWPELLPGVPTVNQGHPGFTTEQLLPVAEEVAAARPRAVLIMAGTNDVRDAHPPEWTVDRLGRILDVLAARSPDTTVVVQSVLPRRETADQIVETNRAIRVSVEARGLQYVDLHPPFDAGDGGLRPDETTDGWHLSDAGYRRWADLLAPVVADLP